MFCAPGFVLLVLSCAGPRQAPRDPLLGAPLVVDGERIPDAAIQRELIYGPARAVLQRAIDRWSVESELATRASVRASDGDDAGFGERFAAAYAELQRELWISDPELDALLARHVASEAIPDWDPEAWIRWEHGSRDELRAALRSQTVFDRVFLPLDPGDWPDITLGAFQEPESERLLRGAQQSWQARVRWARQRGEEIEIDPRLQAMYRAVVRRALRSWLGVRTALDGVELPIVATADVDGDGEADETVGVDDLWPAARARVSEEDVRLAKRWLATVQLVRRRLEQDGRTIPPVVALAIPLADDGFSPEARAVRHALHTAFASGYAPDEDAAERAQELLSRAREALGSARYHVELLHVSAYDMDTAQWLPGGFAAARSRADALRAAIDVAIVEWAAREPDDQATDPGRVWRAMLEANGDLEQPVETELSDRARPRPRIARGHIGARTLQTLADTLEESEYQRLVDDVSAADALAFDLEESAFGGPWRGRYGYVIARVVTRQPPRQELAHKWLREWVVGEAFRDYAREARRTAEISGLE